MVNVLTHVEINARDLAHPTLFRAPWDGSEWLYELKLDGFRALVHKHGRDVNLTSRNGRPLLPAFPEIALALLDLNVDGVSTVNSLCPRRRVGRTGMSCADDRE